jgi:hypothetical protein
METKQARVLVEIEDVDRKIPANKLVEGTEEVIDALESAGLVDPNPAAVKYVIDQGEKPISITGGYLSDKVKDRILANTTTDAAKKMTPKQKSDAIKKLVGAEKLAFEKSGLDIDAWLNKTQEDREALIAVEQAAIDLAAAIEALPDQEKAALTKSGKTLADWQALPEDERKKLIDAEKPAE